MSGYVPRGESITVCQTDDVWKPDPSTLACVEAVALVIGGKLEGDVVGRGRLEVYYPGNSKALGSFVSGSWGQSAFYFEGKVILCGGTLDNKKLSSCVMGEYSKKSGGRHIRFSDFTAY